MTYRRATATASISAFFAFFSPSANSFAQSASNGTSIAAPSLAVKRTSSRVTLDGTLSENAWNEAESATTFTQTDPREGAPGSERTTVRILLGDDALYIGARLDDGNASAMKAPLTRRDDRIESDLFEVFLDTYHDRRTAYVLAVNPSGAIRDAILTSDGARDDTWDPVWYAAVVRDSAGWTVELSIPLSQLHFAVSDGVWGLQLRRFISRKQEASYFAFVPKSEQQDVSRYGTLTGMAAAVDSRHVELLPYAVARHQNGSAGGIAGGTESIAMQAGVDLRASLSRSTSFTATVRPDFGQVDVDPSVVNLTTVETFYPEKRPFFVEGADMFRFGTMRAQSLANYPLVFNSRRIGRAPQLTLSGTEPVGPIETPIDAALKLVRRAKSGWNVGVLAAETGKVSGSALGTDGNRFDGLLEPRTGYGIARARHDYRRGATSVGAISTAVVRDLSTTAAKNTLRSSAFVSGADLVHQFYNRRWEFDASLLASRVNGSDKAITRTQKSNARNYYQRVDAPYIRLDSTRTELSGYGLQIGLARLAAKHWLGSIAYQEASPGLETSDLGFVARVNYRSAGLYGAYKEDKPGDRFRSWRLYAGNRNAWTSDGILGFAIFRVGGIAQLANYWNTTLDIRATPRFLNDAVSQGGPLVYDFPTTQISGSVETDARRAAKINASFVRYHSGDHSFDNIGSLGLFATPRPSASFRLQLDAEHLHDTQHFITRVNDPIAQFGKRYVFATLDQKTLSLQAAGNLIFTPKLSLQGFVQPLLATIRYSNYTELVGSHAHNFLSFSDRGFITGPGTNGRFTVDPDGSGTAKPFSFADPEQTPRTLRGNVVLRWEYRPGALLYAVWQQRRQEDGGDEELRPGGDLSSLLHTRALNTFVIKASFWIAR